jgi:hypothetical protein
MRLCLLGGYRRPDRSGVCGRADRRRRGGRWRPGRWCGAQQLAAVQVVEHQGGRFDPNTDPAPVEDLRGENDELPDRPPTALAGGQ